MTDAIALISVLAVYGLAYLVYRLLARPDKSRLVADRLRPRPFFARALAGAKVRASLLRGTIEAHPVDNLEEIMADKRLRDLFEQRIIKRFNECIVLRALPYHLDPDAKLNNGPFGSPHLFTCTLEGPTMSIKVETPHKPHVVTPEMAEQANKLTAEAATAERQVGDLARQIEGLDKIKEELIGVVKDKRWKASEILLGPSNYSRYRY